MLYTVLVRTVCHAAWCFVDAVWIPAVQAYFSGHDHNLEHLYIGELELHYFVSGGGSDCDRGFQSNIASLWQYPSSGFAAVTVSPREMTVRFFTLDSKTDAAYSAVVRL